MARDATGVVKFDQIAHGAVAHAGALNAIHLDAEVVVGLVEQDRLAGVETQRSCCLVVAHEKYEIAVLAMKCEP